MRLSPLALAPLTLTILVACGGESPAPAAGSAKPAASLAAATSAKPAAAPGSAAPAASASAAPAAAAGMPADWAPLDLTPGGALWKGHTIKAPPGATIKKGFDGPEITKDKDYGVTVSFTATKPGATKAGLKEAVSYGSRPTFLVDTDQLLEYSMEPTDPKSTEGKTFGFHMVVKVGTAPMGCKTIVSKKTREELEPLKEACKSLTKG